MINPHVYPEVRESRWNWNSDPKTTARGLKSSLQSFGVIVGFTVLNNSLYYLKGLSAKPQRRDIDAFEVDTMFDDIKSEIQCLRDDIGVEFHRWYFAESNTIINGKTRDPSPEQFVWWHDDLLTPRSLDNEACRYGLYMVQAVWQGRFT